MPTVPVFANENVPVESGDSVVETVAEASAEVESPAEPQSEE